jgi:hypothetical protein
MLSGGVSILRTLRSCTPHQKVHPTHSVDNSGKLNPDLTEVTHFNIFLHTEKEAGSSLSVSLEPQ